MKHDRFTDILKVLPVGGTLVLPATDYAKDVSGLMRRVAAAKAQSSSLKGHRFQCRAVTCVDQKDLTAYRAVHITRIE